MSPSYHYARVVVTVKSSGVETTPLASDELEKERKTPGCERDARKGMDCAHEDVFFFSSLMMVMDDVQHIVRLPLPRGEKNLIVMEWWSVLTQPARTPRAHCAHSRSPRPCVRPDASGANAQRG